MYIEKVQEIGRENENIKLILMERDETIKHYENRVEYLDKSEHETASQKRDLENKLSIMSREVEKIQTVFENKDDEIQQLQYNLSCRDQQL